MPEIKESVGPGLKNSHDDVALIQAMLVVVKNANGAPYLAAYDGVFGGHTEHAILAFQNDQIFKKQDVAPATPVPGAKTAPTPPPMTTINAKLGSIGPNDATLNQLVSMLPTGYKELNVLPGGSKTVYLPATDDDRKAGRNDVFIDTKLDIAFRGKVAKLIDEVFTQHKIAMWVVPAKVGQDGRWRTFDRQNQLTSSVTGAGPGESFHNYGQASDIGFKQLRWLKADGSIVEEKGYLLEELNLHKDAVGEKALWFWKAMQSAATGAAGLFRGPAYDHDHVQAYHNPPAVSPHKSLAALLTLVGTMKWAGHNNRYQTDFGLGGNLYDDGTAKQIWEKNATVNKTMLATAQTAALTKAKMIAGPASQAWKNFKPVTENDIKHTEIDAMKGSLKSEFDLAADKWNKWKPL